MLICFDTAAALGETHVPNVKGKGTGVGRETGKGRENAKDKLHLLLHLAVAYKVHMTFSIVRELSFLSERVQSLCGKLCFIYTSRSIFIINRFNPFSHRCWRNNQQSNGHCRSCCKYRT